MMSGGQTPGFVTGTGSSQSQRDGASLGSGGGGHFESGFPTTPLALCQHAAHRGTSDKDEGRAAASSPGVTGRGVFAPSHSTWLLICR